MANQSTAILTFTHLLTINPVDGNGNKLLAADAWIETTQVKPKKNRARIDMTNSFSDGFAEWAPGVLQGSWSITGLCDINSGTNLDAIWSTAMDNAYLTQCVFYIIKPAVGNNPLQYSGLVMWEDVEFDWTVKAGGEIARFTAQAWTVGRLTKSGADLTGAIVRGHVQGT